MLYRFGPGHHQPRRAHVHVLFHKVVDACFRPDEQREVEQTRRAAQLFSCAQIARAMLHVEDRIMQPLRFKHLEVTGPALTLGAEWR